MSRDKNFFIKCLDLTVLAYWTVNYGKWNWLTRSRMMYKEVDAARLEKDYDIKKCSFIEYEGTDAQCMFYQEDDNNLYVVFRSSDSPLDWKFNRAFGKTIVPFNRDPKEKFDKVHEGFFASYLSIRDAILDKIKQSKSENIYIVGFSMGSAVGALSALDIKYNFKDKYCSYIGFGTPRLGNKEYKEKFNKYLNEIHLFRRGTDLVSYMPFKFFGFEELKEPIRLGPRKPYPSLFDHYPFKYLKNLRELF